MLLIPFAIVWFGYTLGWYGYVTLQQPVPPGGCIGFSDLILPSRVANVDQCIQNGWGKSSSNSFNAPTKKKSKPPSIGGIPILPKGGLKNVIPQF